MRNLVKPIGLTHVIYAVFLFACLVPVGGCTGVIERRWSEEVELDDGKVIIIDRYVKFQESNSLSGDAYNATDLEVTLAFQGEHSSLASWKVPLVPVLLYRDNTQHEWVIVATTSNCDTWYEHGGPEPPYWEFRLQGENWVKSKLSEASIGRKTNLFFNYEPSLPARRITREIKTRILATKDFAKDYLSIRSGIKTNCGIAVN